MFTPHDVERPLADVLSTALAGSIDLADPATRQASLWSLGLTSAQVISLLTRIEDLFGFEWDLDESSEALGSFDALSATVARQASRRPAADVTAQGVR